MQIIICPGIHDPALTDGFLKGLNCPANSDLSANLLIYPTSKQPAYAGWEITKFVETNVCKSEAIWFVAFSAGVVGAIAAAWQWQLKGGTVKGLIAFDGWGMPLGGSFPIYRVSHDYFTHWSSAVLGAGQESFYADPAVAHLQLWQSPQQVWGWRESSKEKRSRATAAACVWDWLLAS
jgi:hypothetical protein